MSSRLSLSMNAATIPAAQRRITTRNGQRRRKTLALAISATLALGLAQNAAAGFPATVQLSDLDGADGFRLDGVAGNDRSGRALSAAGDVNGDGIDDLLIGALGADPNGDADSGSSYVVFGNSAGFPAALNLASLNGTNGFRLDGVAVDDLSGRAVSAAGDVNGDGIDDLIIGASNADPNGDESGSSYVVFGKDTSTMGDFPATMSLSSLNGTNGFRLDGVAANDNSGKAVSAAGDINGDGFDDLLIGAPAAAPNSYDSGSSYVVFGKDTATMGDFPATISLSSLNGTNGFRLDGVAEGHNSGSALSGAGDVNGDGIDDLLIGARYAGPNDNNSGRSYVVFGKDTATAGDFDATLALASLDGTNGFRLDGVAANDRSGYAVSSAGDINGDGIDDLLIGALYADPNGNDSGSSYVVFGNSAGFTATLNLASLTGTNGFRLDGVASNDRSGRTVSSAGDINGDSFDDLLVGAYFADPNGSNSGSSYVVFGKDTATVGGFPAALNLASLAGTDGFRLDGVAADDRSGRAVSVAGDVNGDGFDDLLIGAYGADPNNSTSGSSYVVFGGTAGPGLAPAVGLTPASMAFGNVMLGQTSAPQAVTLENTGSADLVLGTLALSGANPGDFALGNDTCSSQTIAAAATCTFDVTLTPSATGPRAAQVDIPSNAPTNPDTVPLSGTGESVNDPPMAQDDNVATDEDTILNGNVLVDNGNGADSDVDGDVLTVTEVNGVAAYVDTQITLASGALLTVNGDGSFEYDPNGQFESLGAGGSAIESFDYTISDGQATDSATVTVAINGVDDLPVAADDTATISEDAPVIAIDVLANDTDIDGGPIAIDSATQPAGGTVSITGGGSGLSYQPDPDLCNDGSPTDDFSYTLTPGGSSATVAVTVTCVKDAPAADASTATTDEDNAVTITLTGSDVDGDALTFAIATAPANGSLDAIMPINDTTAEVTYTPDADSNGNDSFNYQVCDPEPLCDTATASITVNAVNDPPIFTAGGDVETFEGTAFDTPWASDISPGPADEAGQSVLFVITGNTNPGLFDVEPALDSSGQLTFTPAADTIGSAEITAVAADDGGTANGGNDISDPTTFTVDVIAVADLALRKRDCADPNRPGGQVTYLLQARNQGPSDATSVMVEDSLPEGMTLVDSIPSGLCSDTGMGILDCDLGALAAGTGLEFSIIAAIDASVMDTMLANVAVISGAESDPVSANNFGTEFTLILSDLIFADNMEKCTPD